MFQGLRQAKEWLEEQITRRKWYRRRLAKLMHYTSQVEEVAVQWRNMYEQERKRRELYERGSAQLQTEMEGYQALMQEEKDGHRADPWEGIDRKHE